MDMFVFAFVTHTHTHKLRLLDFNFKLSTWQLGIRSGRNGSERGTRNRILIGRP